MPENPDRLGGVLRRWIPGLATSVGLLLSISAGAHADATVDFDALAPDTVVTDQYADLGGPGNGVVFGPLPGGVNAYRPVVKAEPAGQAQSGSHVADISVCNNGACSGEFYAPDTTGTFQSAHSRVSVRVGLDGPPVADCSSGPTACAFVTLQAYDSSGMPVGAPSSATVLRGNGFHTLLSVQTLVPTIRGFRVSGQSSRDSNEPVRIDDLSFDAAAPDFTLTPESTSLVVDRGTSVSDRIDIGRTGGSSGDIAFGLSGPLPEGVSARFEPNPVGGASTVLSVTADANSEITGPDPITLTVTGTPLSPGAGFEERSFPLRLQVRGLCRLPPPGVPRGSGPARYCQNALELNDLLQTPFTGRVILAHDGDFNMHLMRELPLKDGVQLVGERGPLGTRPLVYTDEETDDPEKYEKPLFEVGGNDVRVEGIAFQGPRDPKDREHGKCPNENKYCYAEAIKVFQDMDGRSFGLRVVIADNEFSRWTHAGVYVRGFPYEHVVPYNGAPPKAWNIAWNHLGRRDARGMRIEHNFFHHNAMRDGGYGVDVDGGAYATIEGNVFDLNRHAIAAQGKAYSGYIARFNYVLAGGYKEGHSYNQHFDVHGEKNGGWGGAAGDYFDISYNAFRGNQSYAGHLKHRPAFMLRGRPRTGAYFHDNVAVHEDLGQAVSLKDKGLHTHPGREFDEYNFHASGNHFGVDHAREIATGDFDGDGRTDVFLGNGTAWFYSRAAVRPWEFLRPSNKRVRDLGFADIDNDGITDVLYRDAAGRLGFVKSGRGSDVSYFTSAPVPMKELRFGDFDGDGRTDIFYTRGGQWHVWYGSLRSWTATQTSARRVSHLLFGEFDGVRGTDVAAVNSSEWAFSSAATKPWARLGPKRFGSFVDAVAADFDGNGKSDIAVKHLTKWRFSADGRSPLATLRSGADLWRLDESLLGHFDGGWRTEAVEMGFGVFPVIPAALRWDRLITWHGLGSSGTTKSLYDMR